MLSILTVNPAEFRQRLGARIRAARLEARLSQVQLADKLDLSRPAIASIEAGRQGLVADVLVRIAAELKVSASDLLGENEKTQPFTLHVSDSSRFTTNHQDWLKRLTEPRDVSDVKTKVRVSKARSRQPTQESGNKRALGRRGKNR